VIRNGALKHVGTDALDHSGRGTRHCQRRSCDGDPWRETSYGQSGATGKQRASPSEHSLKQRRRKRAEAEGRGSDPEATFSTAPRTLAERQQSDRGSAQHQIDHHDDTYDERNTTALQHGPEPPPIGGHNDLGDRSGSYPGEQH
jgi:hypothetical protein